MCDLLAISASSSLAQLINNTKIIPRQTKVLSHVINHDRDYYDYYLVCVCEVNRVFSSEVVYKMG